MKKLLRKGADAANSQDQAATKAGMPGSHEGGHTTMMGGGAAMPSQRHGPATLQAVQAVQTITADYSVQMAAAHVAAVHAQAAAATIAVGGGQMLGQIPQIHQFAAPMHVSQPQMPLTLALAASTSMALPLHSLPPSASPALLAAGAASMAHAPSTAAAAPLLLPLAGPSALHSSLLMPPHSQ